MSCLGKKIGWLENETLYNFFNDELANFYFR